LPGRRKLKQTISGASRTPIKEALKGIDSLKQETSFNNLRS
jgi:hypothetical protein